MLILAIETATELVGAALVSHEGPVASFQVSRGRRHAETLTPGIEFLLRQAGLVPADLTALAVDVGPGLFTGMRVGIATAKAMAHALDIPVVPVCSLDALATAAYGRSLAGGSGAGARGEGRVVSVLDARRGEVFWASYRLGDSGRLHRHTAPVAATPADLVADLLLAGEPLLLVGDGALRYRDLLTADLPAVSCAEASMALPDVAVVASLAIEAAARGEVTDALGLAPMYLRAPDAEINWRTRDGGGR